MADSPTQRHARLLRERDPHAGETFAQRRRRLDAEAAILQAMRAARIPPDDPQTGGDSCT